jgi:hypothetical protein
MLCSHCSSPLPDPRAKFCPRCGRTIAAAPPVHIERRGTLWNPAFIVSVIFVVAGGLLAGHEQYLIGVPMLVIGIPSLLFSAVRSLSR